MFSYSINTQIYTQIHNSESFPFLYSHLCVYSPCKMQIALLIWWVIFFYIVLACQKKINHHQRINRSLIIIGVYSCEAYRIASS